MFAKLRLKLSNYRVYRLVHFLIVLVFADFAVNLAFRWLKLPRSKIDSPVWESLAPNM